MRTTFPAHNRYRSFLTSTPTTIPQLLLKFQKHTNHFTDISMTIYTEDQLRNAISAVEMGMPARKAAREYGIPRSTLLHRLGGSVSRQLAHDDQKALSPTQEDMLAHWIRVQHSISCTPTHRQIQLAATGILRTSGSLYTIG